jgi:dye decolorizing peroxidase
MSERDSRPNAGISRRSLLLGAGIAVGAAAIGDSVGHAARSAERETAIGSATEPFYGAHQAGVRTAMQAHGVFAAFTFTDSVTASALAGVMKVATMEAERLTRGEPGLSDSDPELAVNPARLTITFGFGHNVFAVEGGLGFSSQRPTGFDGLPAFSIDKLDPAWSGGDLLVHVGADDPLTVSHAIRHMTRVVSSIARPHYAQRGFVRAQGVAPHSVTPRNLFGHVDGVSNPTTDAEFDSHVWAPADAGWFAGGTQLVLRRIAMNLPTWDLLGTTDKEKAIGRRLSNGAPLTGTHIMDRPDFDAQNDDGLMVIPEFSHMHRAHTGEGHQLFLRRPFSYDDGFAADGSPNVGLLFTAYQQNITEQFLPVQQSLADFDLLNLWTTPIGSSEFVIPPGCNSGGYVGETLLG